MALGFAVAAHAQYPRAFGVRGGYGLEASYQHCVGDPHFIEVDVGLDLVGQRGFRLTGIMDFVLWRPYMGRVGTWSLYAGPGVSTGYVYNSMDAPEPSFVVAACVQLGLEFAPWTHFAMAADLRPMYGWDFSSKTSYFRGGFWYGLIPSLSLKYLF